MKKEYDFKKMKKRSGPVKVDPRKNRKWAISIRINLPTLLALQTEAFRLGIPYQTLIGSILHRYTQGDLVDFHSADLQKLIENAAGPKSKK